MFNIFKSKASKQKTLESRLEEAKQQLLSNLENNGMEYLVNAMASDAEYSPLIEERRKLHQSWSSEDTISWYAYRGSEKLHSPEDKASLLKLLEDENFMGVKQHTYRCLASICSNTNDRELFNFLVGKLEDETDEFTRTGILSRLENVVKDDSYNIEPIKFLAREGTEQESNAAIHALSHTTDPEVPELMLAEFKMGSIHRKSMICRPLSTVGGIDCIPVLKEAYKKTRDGFFRMMIQEAVARIEARGKGKRKG